MSKKGKVLVVDDDAGLCQLYKLTLEQEGYEVFTANQGEEGLSRAVELKPELILLDIMMPMIHGLNVLDILKATPETKDIKIIVLSALSDEDTMNKAKEFGASDYIVKSQATMAEVMERIAGILEKK
ncbi:MAG: PAS/PAC sensor hybrid histidine kinase [candidate division CPR2 bacterium GW2011_GWC1_39_9]|uniref:PAS/PAC sensor hybrid histidine kinase n=1 Tax=candidate division CPR2 bacterium GW2011_GWC2_39_10 TaxID=1618345 RepID=A0A0G0PAK9_UNCC2|nr:MAG: PAS/PAC sensor hybrid histidine kinase [candidate division CPR2 bacterium GW2011_GWC2_39_10]KKR32626.1 MAG: PAS/PAC sensor hybrid histidine kinase [candidate division CPR2 bacterium GW2011_GWC1_39_9]